MPCTYSLSEVFYFQHKEILKAPVQMMFLYKCHVHTYVFRETSFFPPQSMQVLSAWFVFLHNISIISVVPAMTVNSFPVEFCTLVTYPLRKSNAGSSTMATFISVAKLTPPWSPKWMKWKVLLIYSPRCD